MKHYGDITKLNGAELPRVDVISGGSPCQDLSVAGLRAGLAGERSGLFMEQIRVIKEMREHDKQLGRVGADVAPRFNIWENVPGALSSAGGKDFQAVLTELARVADERIPDVPFPESGKWGNSGALFGMGAAGCPFSIAWRIHDAQFWGVPQRRRRICVLADWGGTSAARILLDAQYHGEAEDPPSDETLADSGAESGSQVPPVEEGLPGHPEPCGTAGQGTAEGAEDRAGGTSYTLKIRGGIERDSNGVNEDVSFTLNTIDRHAVVAPEGQAVDVYNQSIDGDIAPTVTASVGGTNTSGPKIMSAGFKPRQGVQAKGLGYEKEKAPTISTDENYAVLKTEADDAIADWLS